MRKRIIALILVIMALSGLFACKSDEAGQDEDSGSGFFRKVAREMTDDGWVWTFVYEDLKDEDEDDSDIIKYRYFGINIRYCYDDDYFDIYVRKSEDPNRADTIERVYPATLIAGGGPEAEKRDMKLIQRTILDKNKTVEELLALNPDDYEFESVDKERFFRLMRTALTGDPQKEGTDPTYWDRYAWAVFCEREYLSGYKFQIGFMQETGCIDELYIDVLYQTGDGYRDYVQLSDMIDDGTATAEQKRVFEKIQEIVAGCKESESFIWGADGYKEENIGGIDFSRLYNFMYNIHVNKYDIYFRDTIIETIEGETVQ